MPVASWRAPAASLSALRPPTPAAWIVPAHSCGFVAATAGLVAQACDQPFTIFVYGPTPSET